VIIRCTKCSTEFALDPSQVGPEGVTLRCSVCSHMFHAEPDPDVAPAPWKVATVEKHLSTQPDLRRLLEQVEDGRLRPEDQISRTGQTWIKLGELPEFSSLFIGAEGLPRVFRAVESAPVADLGPPPAYGASVDEVRREETVRFNLATLAGAGSGLRRPPPPPGASAGLGLPGEDDPLPAPPEFDTALPAPPDFDTPTSRRGRGSGVPEPRTSTRAGTAGHRVGAPASMLEAVTKAVAANEDRDRMRDVPDSSEASRARSQPILVADLARAAAASAEKAVQAVDGQRARERAERSTGTFTGAMTRVDPSGLTRGDLRGGSELRPVRSETRPATIPPRGPRETADHKLAAAAARTAELRLAAAAAREAELTQVEVQPGDVTESETADLTRPPEVVIVKMPETGGRSSAPLWGLLGVVAAAGIVFGVPSIREKVFNLGGPATVTRGDPSKTDPVASEDTTPQEVEQARKAIRNLGFKESNKVQAALQRVIDDPNRSPQAVGQARLTQAELVLMRALACKIAVTIEPAAMGGQAQTRSVEDPTVAAELLAGIGDAPVDANQLARVRALQALVAGNPPGELPPESDELAALIKGAPMWRGELRTPPAGLITSLQRLANPSTLSQSVLALALWRSGDVEGARALLRTILDRVSDQPAARTMLEALDRQDMLSENGDPEAAVPPSDPEPEPATPDPEPTNPDPTAADPTAADPTAAEPSGTSSGTTPTPDTKVAVRPTVPTAPVEKVEVLISTGCQKVRQGDAAGVRMLLDAVDRGADPMQNFNLCFCLGAGFARQNSHDAALTWYKRAVQQSPSNRDAIAGAARSAELLGRTSVAVDYYKKLRALDPGNAAATAYLAKHDAGSHDPTPPGDEPPGELMPIKPKNR
jgi:predicted Zn finger-like uncharacterized protein